MNPGHAKWKVYELDTPVIHIQRLPFLPEKRGEQATIDVGKGYGKLMHHFSEDQVESLMDEAEKS